MVTRATLTSPPFTPVALVPVQVYNIALVTIHTLTLATGYGNESNAHISSLHSGGVSASTGI